MHVCVHSPAGSDCLLLLSTPLPAIELVKPVANSIVPLLVPALVLGGLWPPEGPHPRGPCLGPKKLEVQGHSDLAPKL